MREATWVLGLLALGLSAYAWWRRDGSLRRGVEAGWSTLRRTLPLLLIAFVIVGYVQALSPQDLVRTWIGPTSGARGLLIATAAGALMPGGPYVIFPLIAALYRSGAGIGPTIAMITSWASLALLSVSFELPFLGWRFTAIRLTLGLAAPLLVGLAASLIFPA